MGDEYGGMGGHVGRSLRGMSMVVWGGMLAGH